MATSDINSYAHYSLLFTLDATNCISRFLKTHYYLTQSGKGFCLKYLHVLLGKVASVFVRWKVKANSIETEKRKEKTLQAGDFTQLPPSCHII